jgi:hypothetical protein
MRFDWTIAERHARRNVLMEPTENAKVQAIVIRIQDLKLKMANWKCQQLNI